VAITLFNETIEKDVMFHVRGSVLAQVRRCIPSRVLLRPSSTTSWNTGLLSVPIVGRPNVGKSTLFNRFARAAVGRRGGGGSGGVGFGGRRPASKAIVSPVAGTTRDRREGPAAIAGAQFIAVDTGGLESLDGSGGGSAYGDLRSEIAKQVGTWSCCVSRILCLSSCSSSLCMLHLQ